MNRSAWRHLHRFGRRFSRRPWAVRAVVRGLQALVLLFAVQFSGAAHYVADAFFHHDQSELAEHGSRDDDDGDCPPGCPSCHSCGHAQSPYVSKPSSVAAAPLCAAAPHDDRPVLLPPQPARSSVFRPPRA